MIQPILTIAIPTFNRANFLDNCLLHITNQLAINEDRIELLVSDNCSTDNTFEIVQKYVNKGYTIRYIKNEENIGADRNIVQCYFLGLGNYIYTIGDDDILLENSINLILEVLKMNDDFGLVHFNPVIAKLNNNILYKVFTNKHAFMELANYWTTFISGNIINKKFLDLQNQNIDSGTYLNQVHIYFDCLMLSNKNVIIFKKIIECGDVENTGGYNLFKVFAFNYSKIISRIEKKYQIDGINKIIHKKILKEFFPGTIMYIKKNPLKFNHLSIVKNLQLTLPIYYTYYNFWRYVFIRLIMPNFCINIYKKLTHNFKK